MLIKIICIVSIIQAHIVPFNSIPVHGFNESNVVISISTQLNEVKAYGVHMADAKSTGLYEILIRSISKPPSKKSSTEETQGSDWTAILRRMDGSEIFYRNWNAYKKGFGNLDGEFFLGLDKIHALTSKYTQKLLVILEDFEGNIVKESYDRFGIAGEEEQYALTTLGKARGSAGDSLSYNHGMKFTTYDRDNDQEPAYNCAENRTGAWWYGNCSYSNLAGTYNGTGCNKGVTWVSYRGCDYSLKSVIMLIQPMK